MFTQPLFLEANKPLWGATINIKGSPSFFLVSILVPEFIFLDAVCPE